MSATKDIADAIRWFYHKLGECIHISSWKHIHKVKTLTRDKVNSHYNAVQINTARRRVRVGVCMHMLLSASIHCV